VALQVVSMKELKLHRRHEHPVSLENEPAHRASLPATARSVATQCLPAVEATPMCLLLQ
jgi:hypothetical protein